MQIFLPSVYYLIGVIYFIYFVRTVSNSLDYSPKIFFCLGALSLSVSSFALSGLFHSKVKIEALIFLGTAFVFLLCSSGCFFHIFVLLEGKKKLWDKIIRFITFGTACVLPVFLYLRAMDTSACKVIQLNRDGIFTLCSKVTFFKIFYIVCLLLVMITSIIKIIKLYTAEFLVKKKEKYRIFTILTVVIGMVVLIDIFYKFLDDFSFPPFSIVFATILVGYGTSFYPKTSKIINKNLNDELYIIEIPRKRRLYSIVSYAIILLAFLGHGVNFIFFHTYGLRFTISMFYCIFVGVAVIFLQQRGSGIITDVISNILWASVLPIAFTSFSYFSNTILLMVPCIFALLGCIYVDRIFIILFGLSGIITYLIIIAYDSHKNIRLSYFELGLRIILYFAMMYIILAIHKSFVYRIKQLRRHEFFQMAVVNLSQWLVLSQDMDIIYRVEEALKSILEFTQSDRVFVYRMDSEGSVFRLLSSFEKDDTNLAKLPMTIKKYALSDKTNLLMKGHVVIFNQKKEREYQFLQLGSVSTVNVPMNHKDQMIGILCIQSQEEQDFTVLDKQLFKIIANMLSNAIMTSETERMIEHNSTYDILTQLPNRSYFTEMLDYRIEHSADEENKITIVFIDLDAFQEINDLMGHDYGDKILVEVALRFSKALDNKATVSRFGGDEFLILFNDDIEFEEIEQIMEMLMSLFVEPFIILDSEMYLSISCGIAVYPFDGADSKTLIKNADMAMNEAKTLGKGRYVFCSEQMKENIQRRALLIDHLRKALSNEEFKLVFQPQVDSVTHKIKGAEALLRWYPSNTDELSDMVSPGEFIPILEETGMIVEVGRFVIAESVRVIGRLKNELGIDDVVIAVNMSVEQCKDLGILSFLSSQFDRFHIQPKLIDIEVTESAYADENKNVSVLIDEMVKMGVSISIDDFGTGYSNMSRLSRIDIDKIKIDISYVRGIGISEKDEGIVVTIINLARSLGCITLAEGVETEEQLSFLTEKGCELIQGYYFYKPLSEQDFIDTLRKQKRE